MVLIVGINFTTILFLIFCVSCIYGQAFRLRDDEFLVPVLNDSIKTVYKFEDRAFVFYKYLNTFIEAEFVCKSEERNGTLVQIMSERAAEFIALALAQLQISDSVWVGAKNCTNLIQNNPEEKFCWNNGTEFGFIRQIDIIPNQFTALDNVPWVTRTLINQLIQPERGGCVSFQRKMHSKPLFVDSKCDSLKRFICEEDASRYMDDDTSEKILIGDEYFKIYYKKLTWQEAVTHCMSKQERIARMDSLDKCEIVSQMMIRSRPVVETAWIDGFYNLKLKRWTRLSNKVIPSKSNASGYPPWQNGITYKKGGCLLLDRHLHNYAVYLPAYCKTRHAFICKEDKKSGLQGFDNYDNVIGKHHFRVFLEPQDWNTANATCREYGMCLAQPNNSYAVNGLLEVMATWSKEMTSIWLGGLFNSRDEKWYWDAGPKIKNNESMIHEIDYIDKHHMGCLNMDRENYNHSFWYGLNCKRRQPFICVNHISVYNLTDDDPYFFCLKSN